MGKHVLINSCCFMTSEFKQKKISLEKMTYENRVKFLMDKELNATPHFRDIVDVILPPNFDPTKPLMAKIFVREMYAERSKQEYLIVNVVLVEEDELAKMDNIMKGGKQSRNPLANFDND